MKAWMLTMTMNIPPPTENYPVPVRVWCKRGSLQVCAVFLRGKKPPQITLINRHIKEKQMMPFRVYRNVCTAQGVLGHTKHPNVAWASSTGVHKLSLHLEALALVPNWCNLAHLLCHCLFPCQLPRGATSTAEEKRGSSPSCAVAQSALAAQVPSALSPVLLQHLWNLAAFQQYICSTSNKPQSAFEESFLLR